MGSTSPSSSTSGTRWPRKQLNTVVDVLNQSISPDTCAPEEGPGARDVDPAAPGRLRGDGFRARQGHDRRGLVKATSAHWRVRLAHLRPAELVDSGRWSALNGRRAQPGDHRNQGRERLQGGRRGDPLLRPPEPRRALDPGSCNRHGHSVRAWITSEQVQYRVVKKGKDNTLVMPGANAVAPTTCAWA